MGRPLQFGLEKSELAESVFVHVELVAVGSDIQGYDGGLQVAGEAYKLARHKDE